jgi:hypothetical protein
MVGADRAHDFAIEIFDRRKDAAGDDVALDFGEPDFDLVKPRGVSGRGMNAHPTFSATVVPNHYRLLQAANSTKVP